MKFILLLFWAGLCPIVASYLKAQPKYVQWAAFAMGLIPFVTGTLHLYIAPIPWPMWPGWPKGLEISALDFLAIAILVGTKSQGRGLKQIWTWLAYLAAVVVVIPVGQVWLAGFFYAWQIMRVALVCSAAIRLASYPGAPESLFKGIFAGLIFQAGFSIAQAASGAAQAGGEFGSQNLLGLMAHFALFPAFAMLLARKTSFWSLAAFLAAALVDVLTASRATLGLAAIGLTVLSIASIMQSSTPRKFGFVAAGALLIACVAPFAISNIQSRQAINNVESSNSQRAAMIAAAWMIIEDFPLGTGADQYVVVSNMGGYSARAGVNWNASNRGTAVHNSYLLAWAETGVPGFLTMLLVVLVPILTTLRAAFRFKREPESELLLGIGVAMLMAAVHLMYEWLFIMFVFQYMFAMTSGVAIGIVARLSSRARQAGRQHSTAAAVPKLPEGALPSAN